MNAYTDQGLEASIVTWEVVTDEEQSEDWNTLHEVIAQSGSRFEKKSFQLVTDDVGQIDVGETDPVKSDTKSSAAVYGEVMLEVQSFIYEIVQLSRLISCCPLVHVTHKE